MSFGSIATISSQLTESSRAKASRRDDRLVGRCISFLYEFSNFGRLPAPALRA